MKQLRDRKHVYDMTGGSMDETLTLEETDIDIAMDDMTNIAWSASDTIY